MDNETYSRAELERLKLQTGIPHLPTQLTAALRLAIGGEGPRAFDWSDKPHRLVYDACREVERLAFEGEAVAAIKAENARLREALREIGDLADVDADHRSVIVRDALAEKPTPQDRLS